MIASIVAVYLLFFVVSQLAWLLSLLIQADLTKQFPGPKNRQELRWLLSIWWWPLTWPYQAARLLYRTVREIPSLIKE